MYRDTIFGQYTDHYRPLFMSHRQTDRAWLHREVIPITYILTELGIAEERGLDPLQLAMQAGISKTALTNPHAQVTPLSHAWLMLLIIERTGNNGLGFEVGLRLPPTAHGNLGYAMLSCASLREALILLERFWYLRERGAYIQLIEEEQLAIVELQTEVLFPPSLRPVFFDCLLASIFRLVQLLLGETATIGEFWLDYPQPDYYQTYRHLLPPVHYNMPGIQGRLPLGMLDRPLIMSNPESLKQTLALCEMESAIQGNSELAFLRLVQQQFRCCGEYPSAEQVAERLHMSLRTLRRKLEVEGSSYKQLLENARRRDAIRLLDNPQLEIQQIASLLGYMDPTNFSRAFRQWTNKTPREYRQLRQPLLRAKLPARFSGDDD